MSYLIDTDVVVEIRKSEPDRGVAAWWERVSAHELFLSAVTIGELQRGAERLRQRGDDAEASRLHDWLGGIVTRFDDRILPVTAAVTSAWGRQDSTQPIPVLDGLIAATASVNGLAVVTRRSGDMAMAGARVLNPYAAV
ncbi:type II toxin-antitoxin system VapC family toxin [Haloechinothrix salitolerans]|uniref:Ribonuclease VapC n=1 Tax=Haloechinothrix salitolerans TaxID=926830 RepID=A0ABW2CBX4_9PSEU